MVMHTAERSQWISSAVDVYLTQEELYTTLGQEFRQCPRPAIDVAMHGSTQREVVIGAKCCHPIETSAVGVYINQVGEVQVRGGDFNLPVFDEVDKFVLAFGVGRKIVF